jgi:hypothetical protein
VIDSAATTFAALAAIPTRWARSARIFSIKSGGTSAVTSFPEGGADEGTGTGFRGGTARGDGGGFCSPSAEVAQFADTAAARITAQSGRRRMRQLLYDPIVLNEYEFRTGR